MLYSIKDKLTINCRKLIYYSIIYPHLQYCITSWGAANASSLKQLIVLQKRAIRIIASVGYLDHTNDIFKNLKLLKLGDIYKLEVVKFIYSKINSPNPLIEFNFNNQIHNYNLRNRNNLHVVNLGQNLNLLRKRFITHNGCIIFNELPLTSRNILNVNTLKIYVQKQPLTAY